MSNDNHKIRLLIIEAHSAVRHALGLRLRAVASIDVVGTIASLVEAETAVYQHQPDLILLGLSGLGHDHLHQTVRTVARLAKNTVVIVLVPYADELARELFLNAGATRYLLKNIDTAQLIHEIEQVSIQQQNSYLLGKTNASKQSCT